MLRFCGTGAYNLGGSGKPCKQGNKYFGSVDGFSTVEDMADHYLTLIRQVQPHRPYVISGYSMGGLVALAIADKLKKVGEVITCIPYAMIFPIFQ